MELNLSWRRVSTFSEVISSTLSNRSFEIAIKVSFICWRWFEASGHKPSCTIITNQISETWCKSGSLLGVYSLIEYLTTMTAYQAQLWRQIWRIQRKIGFISMRSNWRKFTDWWLRSWLIMFQNYLVHINVLKSKSSGQLSNVSLKWLQKFKQKIKKRRKKM